MESMAEGRRIAVVLAAGTVVAALMWTLLFAFFPVLYLIAAIKVARSNKN